MAAPASPAAPLPDDVPPGDPTGWLAAEVPELDADLVLLVLLTARFGRLVELAFETDAQQRGRTAAEDRVLGALLLVGEPHRLSPTRLRQVLAQTSGGMTKTLARLEGADLVRRVADPDDRRGLLVELTAAGRREARQALGSQVERYDRTFADLDDDDRRRALASVRTLLDALEPALGARPSGRRRAEGRF